MSAFPASQARQSEAGQYRVLVVDDSAVIRTMLSQWLRADGEIEVIGVAMDGQMAVEAAGRLQPDVVLLDVEMPRMTGIEALPGILKAAPSAKVIMVSTLTYAGAEISLRALGAGASDYVAKPQSGQDGAAETFRRDILAKVKALGEVARQAQRRRSDRTVPSAAASPAAAAQRLFQGAPVTLRPSPRVAPKILLIGSSTGGPQALIRIFSEWKTPPKIPIVITQHMPPAFTTILAKRLDTEAQIRCREAEDGDPLVPGVVYLARGDYHMLIAQGPRGAHIRLDQGPPENFCRPAVDPMFRSAAAVYKSHCLAVVLTGMGHDGLAGARVVADAGGTVVAQDQGSSVVWGMPGAVATAGLCSRVVPLGDMSAFLQKSVNGEVQ
jgi:two-component system chemotaxis response regulator CheB